VPAAYPAVDGIDRRSESGTDHDLANKLSNYLAATIFSGEPDPKKLSVIGTAIVAGHRRYNGRP